MLRLPSLRSTVTTLAAAAVLVGGADLASYAGTGHALILGHANDAGGTTALKNTGRGPALSLNSIKSAPPLVVNSSKLVKHLNADMVGGKTAGQLSPPELTYTVGHAGGTLSNAQHLFQVPSPAGTYRITISGLWNDTGSTSDNIECFAVDKAAITQDDFTKIYVLTFTGEADTNDNQVLGSGVATLHKGQHLVLGCDTEFNTSTGALYRPVTISFTKISQNVKKGQPITIPPRNAGRSGLLHR